MNKLVLILIGAFCLNGCAELNGERFHRKTFKAVQETEKTVTQNTEALSTKLDKQNDALQILERRIKTLNGKIEALKDTVSKIKIPGPVAPTPIVESPKSLLHNTVIFGAVEKIKIDSFEKQFDARVDTGATTSSINALDIQEFERNGENWVKFHVVPAMSEETKIWLEAPVLRYVKIRQSTKDESERRIVIELWVQIGAIREKTQFNLADRSQMKHPVLLGREFIKDMALVDVSREYIQTDKKVRK